jgi:hypothetical protein
MSLEAILCPAASQDSVVFSQSVYKNQLEQGCSLDVTPAGSVSARTSRLVGSTLVEEQAHLLELPSQIDSITAVVKHHTPVDADQDKISVIFNKISSIAYDMDERRTEMFPTIVQMDAASVRKELSFRVLQEPIDVDKERRLKRSIECEKIFGRVEKVRRANDRSRASSPSTVVEGG